MLDRYRCAAALILLTGMVMPCAAQNNQVPLQNTVPQGRDPKSCSDAPQPTGPGNQTLSEKLEQTDGVLCPPNVDPNIKAPTPQAGPMPVIPPPGSPGGDPTVRPK